MSGIVVELSHGVSQRFSGLQVFVVQADTGRSLRFPIIVGTLDLRSILCSPDVAEIASNAASAITVCCVHSPQLQT